MNNNNNKKNKLIKMNNKNKIQIDHISKLFLVLF